MWSLSRAPTSSDDEITDENDRLEEIEYISDLSHFEIYGSTPPRTRIKTKNRSWDSKQKM